MSLCIVIGIMTAGGAAGGLAGYLRVKEGAAEGRQQTPLDFFRFVATGIIAAFALPVFLSLAKSPLVADVLAKEDDYPDMLIFAGFCIVAGFSAGPFLEKLSGQLVQEVRQLKGRVTNVEGEVKEVGGNVEKVEARVDSELEGLDQRAASPESKETHPPAFPEQLRSEARGVSLTDKEYAALRALTTKSYRTRSGIAEDAGVSKTKISEILEGLMERNLAEPTISPNTGGRRFKITDLGRAVLQSQQGKTP